MPFCPSTMCAKNVGITIECVECEKPYLLFNAKKLFKMDKTILNGFLDIIFYTCGISFYNTDDLSMAILLKQLNDTAGRNKGDENDENKHENLNDKDSNNKDEESDSNTGNTKDSICKLFSRIFVNDSWTCTSQVKKSYYSAGIYLDICIECENLDVNRAAKDKHSRYNCCGDNTISKYVRSGNKVVKIRESVKRLDF